MLKKEKHLYILLAILFIVYALVEFYSPKPLDWAVTFSEKDKNPYGGYILYDRLEDFFTKKNMSFQTLYEAKDSTGNMIILAQQFAPSPADVPALDTLLNKGNNILISAHFFPEAFLDSLGIAMKVDYLKLASNDSSEISFDNREIFVPDQFIPSGFNPDSIESWNVHATSNSRPILISRDVGKARLIICTAPMLFTNYSLIDQEYRQFASFALRLLPEDKVTYNRFYHSGKPEPVTPFRYLLSQDPLRWALYLSAITLLIFLIINSQRRQRAIPVLESNRNTTIDYIKTIGGLYFRRGNHKNAAEKIIQRFLKNLGDKYHIHEINERAFHIISHKAMVPVDQVIDTFALINTVGSSKNISEEQLKELFKKIKNIQKP